MTYLKTRKVSKSQRTKRTQKVRKKVSKSQRRTQKVRTKVRKSTKRRTNKRRQRGGNAFVAALIGFLGTKLLMERAKNR